MVLASVFVGRFTVPGELVGNARDVLNKATLPPGYLS
jgi:hypothetical protein